MTKRKLTKRQDDIRRGLTTPKPYDSIHTCSKGCKKAGCNRGLHDTIEEQNAQIEGLKQDLLEQTAAVRHLRMERLHDLNQIGGLQEENARLKAEIECLRKELADAQENYHMINEMVAKMLKEGKQS
ncbi:hypothetical protein UFOVP1233_29 [uncultured Caudovirales phage]|uniref:Uncharacterized protein n=1 Tax=uncultured Caudovirales phage TaxID=2100421 RepID=A0A6J5R9B3_9CAUD|nr:hypothetical protein UFOVP1233_29 [uncultured Caudovirales phage]